MKKNKLVIIETPFAGDIKKNIEYARKCMRDCFMRGEFPFASHLLYTQEGILNDKIQKERNLGIEAGLSWGKYAGETIVYIDLGISDGMKKGIERAKIEKRKVKYRKILSNSIVPPSNSASQVSKADEHNMRYQETSDNANIIGNFKNPLVSREQLNINR